MAAQRQNDPKPDETPSDPGADALAAGADAFTARIAELEAENATLREAADVPTAQPGKPRLVWVVIYPRISVQPKGDDGEPLKVKDKDGERLADPIVLEKGAILPPECEWQAEQLKSFGHVTALSVLA